MQTKEKQYLKNQMIVFKNQSQTHSELLKTIIFPKDFSKFTKGLPDPRYEDNRSEQAPQTDKQLMSQGKPYEYKNYASQATKDSSGGGNSSVSQLQQQPAQKYEKQRSLAESLKLKNQSQRRAAALNQQSNPASNSNNNSQPASEYEQTMKQLRNNVHVVNK